MGEERPLKDKLKKKILIGLPYGTAVRNWFTRKLHQS